MLVISVIIITMASTEITESEAIQKWKSPEVAAYLEASGMAELIDKFSAHHITGKDLLGLTEKDVRRDLGISDLHMRKKVMRHVERLRHISGKNCMAFS